MGIVLAGALTAALIVPVPTKCVPEGAHPKASGCGKGAHSVDAPPAVAFEQSGLYRAEIGLVVFYAALLILTPAFVGIVQGRLPSEISARGVKVGEKVAATEAATKERLKRIEARLKDAEEDVTDLQANTAGAHAHSNDDT